MLRPLILLLAIDFLSFAQNISRAQCDEAKMIALENLWNQIQVNHDADAMGKMLDGDFVLTDHDGTVMSKARFLAAIRDKSSQLTVEASEDMQLHRHGDTVIVTRAYHAQGTQQRPQLSPLGRLTAAWLDEDCQWLCLATHLSLCGE